MANHNDNFPTIDELVQLHQAHKKQTKQTRWKPFFNKLQEMLQDPKLPDQLRKAAARGETSFELDGLVDFAPNTASKEEREQITDELPFSIPGELVLLYFGGEYGLYFEA